MNLSASDDIRSGAVSQMTAAIASTVMAICWPVVGLTTTVVVDSSLEGDADSEVDAATIDEIVGPVVGGFPPEQPAKTLIAPTRTAAFQGTIRGMSEPYHRVVFRSRGVRSASAADRVEKHDSVFTQHATPNRFSRRLPDFQAT